MAKKSTIRRALQEMEAELDSVSDLKELLESIEVTHTQSDEDEGTLRIKIPYVSAQPIHGGEWAIK